MTAAEKAVKILSDARLTIERVSPDGIAATCRGFTDGNVYVCGYLPETARWHCSCKANTDFQRRCAHLIALQLVTVKPRVRDERRPSVVAS